MITNHHYQVEHDNQSSLSMLEHAGDKIPPRPLLKYGGSLLGKHHHHIVTAAQPKPQLTTPTRSCFLVWPFLTVKGPPLSP